MSKVLWLSDAGCHTGFGRVTHSIGERLVEDYGHDISVLAVNYRGDFFPGQRDPTKQPLKLYPAIDGRLPTDTFGQLRIVEMLNRVKPDAVVVLNDPQLLLGLLFDNNFDKEKILLQHRPILYYAPCDGINLPPLWTTALPKITNVVAMSRWGQSQYQPSRLVYHGVDTDQWWPVEERPITLPTGEVLRDRRDCKKAFGFERHSFVIGRVDSNSDRKDFASTFIAAVPILTKHQDVRIHFHTVNKPGVGVRLESLFSRYPDIPVNRITTPDMKDSFIGWDQQTLNALVNAFDITVSTSRGEGFGLGLAESLACGVPVIAQNVSAIPEVVGPGGLLIEPQRLITVPSGEDNWLADIDAFTEAIKRLYEDRELRRELGRRGIEHVRSNFSWEVAARKFDEYIRAIEANPGMVEWKDAVPVDERTAGVGA